MNATQAKRLLSCMPLLISGILTAADHDRALKRYQDERSEILLKYAETMAESNTKLLKDLERPLHNLKQALTKQREQAVNDGRAAHVAAIDGWLEALELQLGRYGGAQSGAVRSKIGQLSRSDRSSLERLAQEKRQGLHYFNNRDHMLWIQAVAICNSLLGTPSEWNPRELGRIEESLATVIELLGEAPLPSRSGQHIEMIRQHSLASYLADIALMTAPTAQDFNSRLQKIDRHIGERRLEHHAATWLNKQRMLQPHVEAQIKAIEQLRQVTRKAKLLQNEYDKRKDVLARSRNQVGH